MIFSFSKLRRILTKIVGLIPKMMRLVWFWSQISISSNKKWKNWHFLSQPIIFNVNIWIFFRHFRLPVTSETSLSARTSRFSITCKKPFDDISNLWLVIWSSDLGYLKKSYLSAAERLIFNAFSALFLARFGTNQTKQRYPPTIFWINRPVRLCSCCY